MPLPRLFAEGRTRQFAGLVACGLGRTGAAVGAALLARYTFDALIRRPDTLMVDTVGWMVAGFAGIALAFAGLRVLEGVTVEALGQSYVASTRLRLLDHLLDLPVRRLRERRRGHLMLRFIGDLNAVRLWISNGVARIVVAGLTTAGTIGVLAVLNLHIAVTVLVVLSVMGVLLAVSAKPLSERVRMARRRRSQLAGNLGEKLSEAVVVQAFGRSSKERDQLKRQNARLVSAMVAQARLSSLVRVLPEVAATLAAGLVILVGVIEIGHGRATPGTIVGALTILGVLTAPLTDLSRVFDYWRRYGVARRKIEEFLSVPSLSAPPERNEELAPGGGALRFEAVSVTDSVEHLTMDVAPGSVVALVGPNGAGKSTLLMLAAGLIPPDSGRILIDEQDLARCTVPSIRDVVGIVSPDLPLLRGSVGWNLRYRLPDASDEAVDRVIRLCGLADAIRALPKGLETRIQEGGRNVSAGVRQRLMLARALLGAPPILLLDEVDAELDREGCQAVDAILRDRKGTTVIATHDLERLLSADVICCMEQGRIVEYGPRDEVLGRPGPTTRLFAIDPITAGAFRIPLYPADQRPA